MDYQFGSFNSETEFNIQRVGVSNLPSFMNNGVHIYTPASQTSISEQFDPLLHSTMAPSLLSERLQGVENKDVEMAPVLESVDENVVSNDSTII